MDFIGQILRSIMTLIGIKSKRATEFVNIIMHSLIIYVLLSGSGIALFASSFSLFRSAFNIAVVLLLVSLFGIAAWSERKRLTTVNMDSAEQLISVLAVFVSVYLTIVGVGIAILIQFSIISRLSWELTSVFIFIGAFLVYWLSDLAQIFDREGSDCE